MLVTLKAATVVLVANRPNDTFASASDFHAAKISLPSMHAFVVQNASISKLLMQLAILNHRTRQKAQASLFIT